MIITDFKEEHLEQAAAIAMAAYEKERGFTPALPKIKEWPDLRPFAENGLGAAALEGGRLVGYLGVCPPFNHAFRSTDARGVFSPIHANATVEENRGEIYLRLYQEAGRKWARAGAVSHAVCLYAHEHAAQRQFFELGFGLRCMDALKRLSGTDSAAEADGTAERQEEDGVRYTELTLDRAAEILKLEHGLDRHMADGPAFILRPSDTEQELVGKARRNGVRFFGAVRKERIIAFLRVERDGETFLCGMPGYIHITGAYCLPEFRGKGIYSGLLTFVEGRLREEGYPYLGVDFESINPPAHHFWRKHFQIYTHGLVRRIDEHAVCC